MLPLGIFDFYGFDIPLEKNLELIAKAGFNATCIWLGDEDPMIHAGKADTIPGLVRQYRLTLDNVHATFWHSNYLWSTVKDEQSVIREEFSYGLSYCGRHQIPHMVVHISGGKIPPPPNQSGLQLIHELVKQAEKEGVTIALENLGHLDSLYLDYVFSNIQSPNLGFCYDSSHDNIASEFRSQALDKWGSLLAATHFSDNHGINDDHLLPEYGSIDWEKVMKQFPQSSYKGTIMLEVDGPEANKGFTPEGFLKTAYQKAQKLADMAEKAQG
jgi:sugar phosphate isomerase/epimerase